MNVFSLLLMTNVNLATNMQPIPHFDFLTYLYECPSISELLKSKLTTAEKSMTFFKNQRMMYGGGVTRPAQIRYIKYYEKWLMDRSIINLPVPSKFSFGDDKKKDLNDVRYKSLKLCKIKIWTIPHFDLDNGCDPYFLIMENCKHIYDSRRHFKTVHYRHPDTSITLEGFEISLAGDIKIILVDEDFMKKDEMMFHYIFNTNFIENSTLHLTKFQVDEAFKDKKHKDFDKDFAVDTFFK